MMWTEKRVLKSMRRSCRERESIQFEGRKGKTNHYLTLTAHYKDSRHGHDEGDGVSSLGLSIAIAVTIGRQEAFGSVRRI